MSPALLVVPPLLKYLAGPLLGPAMLAGVAKSEGVPVRTVDLNAHWLRRFQVDAGGSSPVGDHARPAAGFDRAAQAWENLCLEALGAPDGEAHPGERPARVLPYEFESVHRAAERLAWCGLARDWMATLAGSRPRFVGVSVLWSGQVLGALVATLACQRLWPGVEVYWGGAHVAALAPEISANRQYGALVDGFVAGYAERSFRAMLRGNPTAAPGVFRAGCGRVVRAIDEPGGVPEFDNLDVYGVPRLTLPAQLGRGCAYARCAFCTYPAIEGQAREVGNAALMAVTRRAASLGADVAIKDALAPPARLDAIAQVIDGRARWAACTRLVPRLGRERLQRLVSSGLATLEVGIESIDERQLGRMRKAQPPHMVEGLLGDAAGLDLCIVLNTMWGFPGQTSQEVAEEHAMLRRLVDRNPQARVFIESNRLQVERRSPLAAAPGAFGISLGRSWPWSSVYSWSEARIAHEEVA